MQIKTTLRFHFTPVRMAKVKNSGGNKCWQGCGERGTPPLLVGLQEGITTLEISLEVPQKTERDTTGGPCYTTPEHIPRGFSGM